MARLSRATVNYVVMVKSMETVWGRLDWAMKRAGMKQVEFARKMGEKPQTVHKWKERDSIPHKHAVKASRILRVDCEWLENGIGTPEMAKQEEAKATGIEVFEWQQGDDPGPDSVMLEVLDAELGADRGPDEKQPVIKLPLMRHVLEDHSVRAKDAKIVRILGSAMSPLMSNGDTIAVDTSDTRPIIDGEIYAVWDIELLRVKYLFSLPGGGLRLKSLNSTDHPDEDLSAAERQERINIIGRAFWLGKNFKKR